MSYSKLPSKLIQGTVAKKLQRRRRVRFAQECSKLQRSAEQVAAEEFSPNEAEWPEY